MSRYVHFIVRDHPGMQPFRDAGEQFHVFSSPAWVGTAAVPEIDSDGFHVEVRRNSLAV